MINPKFILIITVIIAATVTGCSGLSSQSTSIPSHMVTEVSPVTLPTETPSNTAQIGLPNPATVYCEEQGGSVEIRTDDTGGQYGVCIFQDGSECDEWAFFRGECKSDAHVHINDDYGFSISAPAPWTFEEHPDYLILNKPGYRFFSLAFRERVKSRNHFAPVCLKAILWMTAMPPCLDRRSPNASWSLRAKTKLSHMAAGSKLAT